jgi:hypothetical protein
MVLLFLNFGTGGVFSPRRSSPTVRQDGTGHHDPDAKEHSAPIRREGSGSRPLLG